MNSPRLLRRDGLAGGIRERTTRRGMQICFALRIVKQISNKEQANKGRKAVKVVGVQQPGGMRRQMLELVQGMLLPVK